MNLSGDLKTLLILIYVILKIYKKRKKQWREGLRKKGEWQQIMLFSSWVQFLHGWIQDSWNDMVFMLSSTIFSVFSFVIVRSLINLNIFILCIIFYQNYINFARWRHCVTLQKRGKIFQEKYENLYIRTMQFYFSWTISFIETNKHKMSLDGRDLSL